MVICWYQSLTQLLEVLPWDLRQSCEGLHERAPPCVPTRKVQCSWLEWPRRPCIRPSTSNPSSWILHSTTARRLSRIVVGLWNNKFCLTPRVATSSSPSRSWYLWGVCLSRRRYGPGTISLTIQAQTLMLKRILYPRSRTAWGLSHAQSWLLCSCERWTHPHTKNVLHLSTICCVRRSHPQCIDVVICNIVS